MDRGTVFIERLSSISEPTVLRRKVNLGNYIFNFYPTVTLYHVGLHEKSQYAEGPYIQHIDATHSK